jgi:hypothetical protein
VSDLQKDNNIKASSGREGTIIQRLQMRDMRGNKMTPQKETYKKEALFG